MEAVFHEKQEGSLCAQHCLNNLLQGKYFTAVDLAEIARQLDESERQHMAEAGLQSQAYQTFLKQPSSNFDDSGYFSIQVLQSAVRVWNLDLVPYQSSDPAVQATRENPLLQNSYICNFKDHWFSVRKLGKQWFNLNSLLSGPELISDTYLALFLVQLQQEGYSIFIVAGKLPACEANDLLNVIPAVQPIKPKLLSEARSKSQPCSSATRGTFQEEDLQRALQESQKASEIADPSLQRALVDSMHGIEDFLPDSVGGGAYPSTSGGESFISTPSSEEVRMNRHAFLSRLENTEHQQPAAQQTVLSNLNTENHPSSMSEEEMLQRAIQMSMKST